MTKDELIKQIAELVEAINTKPDKRKSCAKLAQLFYNEKDQIDVEITNKTIQEISSTYRLVFILKWCLHYMAVGEVDHATDIVKEFVNKKNISGDHYHAQGKVLFAIAAELPDEYDEYFPSIIAEILITAKKCEETKDTNRLVLDIVFLFRKKDIQENQVISVLNHFNDNDDKDWSIWALLGQRYAAKKYILKFKMILEYSESNHEVMIADLDDLFDDMKNDLELEENIKSNLLRDFSLLTHESSFSMNLKNKIQTILKRNK